MLLDTTERSLFPRLDDRQIHVISAFGERVRFAADETMVQQGETGHALYVVLSGQVRVTKSVGGDSLLLAVHEQGGFAGELSILSGLPAGATIAASTDVEALRIPPRKLIQLIAACPQVAEVIVPALAARRQIVVAQEHHREKLAALGRMAAGLAHELNNPAAAVRRAAAQLGEALAGAQTAADRLSTAPLGDAERASLERLRADVSAAQPALSPLEQSEREEAVGAWLESRGHDDAWELAAALAASGVTPERLDRAAAALDAERLGDAVRLLASSQSAAALLREVAQSADRIFALVQSMKQYSNMDGGRELEAVDLHLGLESTLALLEARLSPGITTEREYDTSLPPVCVFAGELNQVWTHVIENAVHAMEGRGRLRIRTSRQGSYARVAITDDGPGIEAGRQEQIWEPFFTTRGVGEGLGMGLEIVRYVVQRRHGGTVHLASRPGETTFSITLPLAGPPGEAQRD